MSPSLRCVNSCRLAVVILAACLHFSSGTIVALLVLLLGSLVVERLAAEGRFRELKRSLECRIAERSATIDQRATELAQKTRILQAILDSMADGVVVANLAGEFVLFNPAAERILGIGLVAAPPEHWSEIYGLYLLDGLTPYPSTEVPLARALRGETVNEDEFVVRHPGRPAGLVLSVNACPVRDETGTVYGGVAVFRDVTEHRALTTQLEQRVADRTADLQASNRELEAFSYSVSHDLRSPLRSIDGFSQALLEDYSSQLDATALDYLRRIRTATQRMGQLIDDLLKLSRATRAELHREQCDLSTLAQNILNDLARNDPGRHVQVTIHEVPPPRGDAQLLRVALENLLGNAWKFTSRCDNPQIEFGYEQRSGQVVYLVRDNGAGFEMAYAHKLFGAFQRLHTASEFAGNGIGLAIVQRVVHRHCGRIWADGTPGKGATFYFTLEAERNL